MGIREQLRDILNFFAMICMDSRRSSCRPVVRDDSFPKKKV